MNSLILASCLTLVVFGAGALHMQDKKADRFTHPKSKDADGGMARWMATMKPGPAHQRLHELLGTYDTVLTIKGMGGGAGMESKGTAEVSWFAEGKWLQVRSSGAFFGQQVETLTLLGYDNFKERYVSCKIDSLVTEMQTSMGHFDESGDNLILWGTIDEPMTPEQDKMVKYVYRGFGKDEFVFEIHDMMIGETNTMVVDVRNKRRK